MIKDQIKSMTPEERLEAMEALWDTMRQDDPEPESPPWHADVLAERRRMAEAGETMYVRVEELRGRRR